MPGFAERWMQHIAFDFLIAWEISVTTFSVRPQFSSERCTKLGFFFINLEIEEIKFSSVFLNSSRLSEETFFKIKEFQLRFNDWIFLFVLNT